eukprot:4913475-Amphidinium_carterae.1
MTLAYMACFEELRMTGKHRPGVEEITWLSCSLINEFSYPRVLDTQQAMDDTLAQYAWSCAVWWFKSVRQSIEPLMSQLLLEPPSYSQSLDSLPRN